MATTNMVSLNSVIPIHPDHPKPFNQGRHLHPNKMWHTPTYVETCCLHLRCRFRAVVLLYFTYSLALPASLDSSLLHYLNSNSYSLRAHTQSGLQIHSQVQNPIEIPWAGAYPCNSSSGSGAWSLKEPVSRGFRRDP